MNNSATVRPLRSLRTLLLCALPVLGLTSFTACAISAVSVKGDLAQSVADAKSIAVASENGSVEVIRDDSATAMQISATIRCSGTTEEEAAARVKAARLTAERDANGKVRIAVEFPPREGAMYASSSDDAASIVIRAASLDGIEITTTNGSIDVGAFRGAAKLTTSNGSIEIRGHDGSIDARSSNGAIRASEVRAPIAARTSNGRINISLAADAQGDVSLTTSNGAVLLELGNAWQGTVTADTSNGRIDLAGGEVVERSGTKVMTIGDAAKAKTAIDTSNGSVTVRAAKK